MRPLAVLNLALAAFIALLVTSSRQPVPERKPLPDDAYRFPTRDSHAAIDDDDASLADWAGRLGCTRTELAHAMGIVGRSEHAVRAFLAQPA